VGVQHAADGGVVRIELRVQQRFGGRSMVGADGAAFEIDDHEVVDTASRPLSRPEMVMTAESAF
jgi:hypothetical protein